MGDGRESHSLVRCTNCILSLFLALNNYNSLPLFLSLALSLSPLTTTTTITIPFHYPTIYNRKRTYAIPYLYIIRLYSVHSITTHCHTYILEKHIHILDLVPIKRETILHSTPCVNFCVIQRENDENKMHQLVCDLAKRLLPLLGILFGFNATLAHSNRCCRRVHQRQFILVALALHQII